MTTTQDCPECQVAWVESLQPGCRVLVTLPPDVAPWWDETATGATWEAEIVTVNGDSLDVTTPTGGVEPVDAEFCRALTSSAADSLAPTFPLLPRPEASKGAPASKVKPPACGRSSRASSAKPTQLGLWSKTSTPAGEGGCPSCGATCGPEGMPLCRFTCEPRTLASPTPGVVSSCWPTPSKRDWRGTSSASWRTSNPTPDTLPDALAAALSLPVETTFWADPSFVAVLMGFPDGWTHRVLQRSGMPSSRRAPR